MNRMYTLPMLALKVAFAIWGVWLVVAVVLYLTHDWRASRR